MPKNKWLLCQNKAADAPSPSTIKKAALNFWIAFPNKKIGQTQQFHSVDCVVDRETKGGGIYGTRIFSGGIGGHIPATF